MIGGKARFIDLFGVDRSNQGAIRFPVVVAVAETALTEIGAKLREGLFDFLTFEVAKAEFLQAR